MSRKRAGWRTGERIYRDNTQDLARRAERSRWEPLRVAGALALLEIEQSHAHYYRDCKGGCPAHEAMEALRAALSGVTR